ncbi:MAG TPA: ubiquinone/menaquinone biosynthesis methyltransferase [Spirochaetota bacterium]|nr:ubiquinone/menaquinone biosynthesis methyltransferase [Spirochaetota bacterium]
MSTGSKSRPLQKMFSEVPRRYDLINRLFTLRLDERWRRRAAEECLSAGAARILDLCTGTGDLAVRIALSAGTKASVFGVDFSIPMLEFARAKAAKARAAVAFSAGDAGELPFRDGIFNVIGIAFGFRNLTYRNPGRDRYLAEILRVLAPGGRFVIVESSQPRSKLFRALVHLYTRVGVSFIGGIVSGQGGAYQYLAHSAVNFHGPEELADLLRSAGFSRVEYRPLLGGVAAIHIAFKGDN